MNGRRAVLSTQLTYGTTLTTIYRDCRVKGRHFFTLKNDRRLSTPNNSKCYIPCLWNECGGQVSLLESRRSEHLKSVYASVNMDNYPSHGFVEVGEAAPHNGNYNLLKHRCESVDDMSKSNETLFSLYRNLLRDFRALQSEMSTLTRKVRINDRWEHRYSKRVAIMANLLLGMWIFWTTFMERVRRRKGKIIRVVMGKRQTEDFQTILTEAYGVGLRGAWLFFFFAFMLTRPLAWARWTGVVLSSGYSLYLAIYSKFLPWSNYFNVLTNLLYVTATIKENPKAKHTPTLEEFMEQSTMMRSAVDAVRSPPSYQRVRRVGHSPSPFATEGSLRFQYRSSSNESLDRSYERLPLQNNKREELAEARRVGRVEAPKPSPSRLHKLAENVEAVRPFQGQSMRQQDS